MALNYMGGDVGQRFLARWAVSRPVTPALQGLDEVVRRCERLAECRGLCIAIKRHPTGRWRGYAARELLSKIVKTREYRDVTKPGGEVVVLARVVYRAYGRDFSDMTEADAYGRTKARLLGERYFDIFEVTVGPDGAAYGSRPARRVVLLS